jgi:hypothetical protein
MSLIIYFGKQRTVLTTTWNQQKQDLPKLKSNEAIIKAIVETTATLLISNKTLKQKTQIK